jgi:hypothetical protein
LQTSRKPPFLRKEWRTQPFRRKSRFSPGFSKSATPFSH